MDTILLRMMPMNVMILIYLEVIYTELKLFVKVICNAHNHRNDL